MAVNTIRWIIEVIRTWRRESKALKPPEREIIHDCRPIGIPPGSLTGRLECRICQKRIGRHEEIDMYGNWQHPRNPRLDYGPGTLLAPGQTATVNVPDNGIRRGPGFRGGYDLEDTSDQGIGECGFPGCRCIETNRFYDRLLDGTPIGYWGGIPVVVHRHSRNGL